MLFDPDTPDVYARIHNIWKWALVTPLLYLGGALLAHRWNWVAEHDPDAAPLERMEYLAAFGLVIFASYIALFWLRLRRERLARQLDGSADDALFRWTRLFYGMAALADSLGLAGLLLYVWLGDPRAVIIGGALAYIGYGLCHPSRREFNRLDGAGV